MKEHAHKCTHGPGSKNLYTTVTTANMIVLKAWLKIRCNSKEHALTAISLADSNVKFFHKSKVPFSIAAN